MTELMKLIMQAVEMGATKGHIKYLPEVLALVCRQKLKLVKADVTGIVVELP